VNVTVTRKSKPGRDAVTQTRYEVTFDALPGRTFGPWGYHEMHRDLIVSALLEPVEARGLVLDAWRNGTATCPTGRAW
jgi:hypothetical protein